MSALPLHHRPALLALVALLAVLAGGTVRGEDDTTTQRLRGLLGKARYHENTEGNHAQALDLYEELLTQPALEPDLRGDALLGRARCLIALGQPEEAETTWELILGDPTLPGRVRDQATKDRNDVLAQRSTVNEDELREEAFRRLQEKRREEARLLTEQARRALDEGRLELARQLCLDAKMLLPENPEADQLLERINKAMPDMGDLVSQILRFADTMNAQEYRRTKSDVERLYRLGIERYKADALAEAAEHFRAAIERVDGSEFLADLREEREYALRWLRSTIETARERGQDLGAEPSYPDVSAPTAGIRRRFYDLVSEFLALRPDEEDPIKIYEAHAAFGAPEGAEPSVAATAFPSGITVTRADATLTRAAWAEHWIRENVGTGWTAPRGGNAPPRVLDRFGDVLIVQNNRAAHRKVEEILSGFGEAFAPVAVDVAVLAATTAGGTRLAARLGLRAEPREEGYGLVVSNRLFEEALEAVKGLEGVLPLGTARLTLVRRPTATIELTARSENHPVYDGLPAPPLVLEADEARYGIWLALYAEDLSRAAGARRGALGVIATTRTPRGSIVVPKTTGQGDWARIPRPMAQEVVEGWRIVPHAGTLVLQGLTNPFPDSMGAQPGLVLLLGVRPADDGTGRVPTPDPPRVPTPSAVPGAVEEREYALGPLATEVVDDLLMAGWPRRPMTVPVPAATVRNARELYLAGQLGGAWSGLTAPGESSPITVAGDVAQAALPPEGHARLQAAVDRLRAADTALFEVDVVTAEVGEETLADWLRQGAVEAYTPGTYLLTTPAGVQALDQRMRSEAAGAGLYTMQNRLLARATQKVAAHDLHTLRIVEDVRLWRHTDGTMRYTPVPGLAEEGIVVLVRPDLETDGRRLVGVEAQAARLKSLERVRLPDVELATAQVTVPRHHPVATRQAAARLSDAEAVLLTLPSPEGTGRVILVKVQVTKIQ